MLAGRDLAAFKAEKTRIDTLIARNASEGDRLAKADVAKASQVADLRPSQGIGRTGR